MSKLPLSPEEWRVFQDLTFMPLKQQVWEKMEQLLEDFSQVLSADLSPTLFPFEEKSGKAKISRGENYHSYAYRVLDYPRLHQGKEFLLFRTLILWGHPIGFHLILSENYRRKLGPTLPTRLLQLPQYWQISAQDSPWIWEPRETNLPFMHTLQEQEINRLLRERKFLKISRFLPLERYSEIGPIGRETWRSLTPVWTPEQT